MKRLPRGWILALWLVGMTAAVRAEEPAPNPALPAEAQQLEEKAALLQAYRARFSMEAKEPDGQLFQLEGTLLYQAPNRRRMEMHRIGSKDQQLLVSDGKTEWQFDPQAGTAYRIVDPKEPPGPHRPFSEALPGSVRFLGRQAGSAGEIAQFEAKPVPESVDGAPVPVEKIRIEVDVKTGLAVWLALLDAQDNPVMTQKFSDFQVNGPVSEKEFVFVPKQGMAVVDLPSQKGDSMNRPPP